MDAQPAKPGRALEPLALDAADIARHLRVTKYSVHRWVKQAKLPPCDLQIGGKRLWNRKRLMQFLRERGLA